MKKVDLITSLVLVPLDYCMLVAAGLTSYALRYQGFVTQYRPVFFDYPFSEFFPLLLSISAVGVLIFAVSGSYRITSSHTPLEVISKVFLGVSTTLLLVIVIIFLQRELFSSRFVIILTWGLAIIYTIIGRMIVFKLKSLFLRAGFGTHALVLLGDTKSANDIKEHFAQNPQLGYRVQVILPIWDTAARQNVLRLQADRLADEILETRDGLDRQALVEVIDFCHEHTLTFRYVPSLYQTKTINVETDSIAGYPILQVHRTPLHGWGKVYKRILDVLVASIGLVLTVPLSIIAILMIRIDTPGPLFVRLKRVGRGGEQFTLYKFRSMIVNAHELKDAIRSMNERSDGPLFKVQNDPRITRAGHWLRKTSIDEIPQLWNVLKGEMSLVGPRPHEPEEVQRYRPEDRGLLAIKPGITGLAQVSGRSNLLFAEEVTLDTYYIENWSLRLDLQILAKTLIVVFKFREAA